MKVARYPGTFLSSSDMQKPGWTAFTVILVERSFCSSRTKKILNTFNALDEVWVKRITPTFDIPITSLHHEFKLHDIRLGG